MDLVRRRRFLFASGALLAASIASAQQGTRLPVLAYVFGTARTADMQGPDPVHPHSRVFIHRLRDLGWEDGRNIVIERYSPENRLDRARAIFADLVTRKVDVICANAIVEGTVLAVEAVRATRTIPIIFAGGSDAVALGLVASLASPGGNVTGVTVAVGPEFGAKRLQLLKEIAPRIRRIAYLGPKTDPQLVFMRDATQRLGLTLIVVETNRMEQLPEAFKTVTNEKVDALLVSTAGVNRDLSPRIAAFAAQRKLPTSFVYREAAEAGGLVSYGVDILAINRRVAEYVDRVLRGAKPADLPVEQPSKFELVINLKTAKALGLTIPQSVLVRADAIIP